MPAAMNGPSIPTWQRSAFQPGGAPNVFQLFGFSTGPLADVPMSASRFGLPSTEVMKFIEVRELPRELDAAWFDGFRSGSLRALAAQALGGDLSGLDGATQLTAVLISRPDAADLAHVQAGWALAKWLVARGVTVLLDAQTNLFWKGADVADWPAVRPFALSTDVNVVVEAEPTSPRATIHTRGLQKFGRPDLVVLDVPGAHWDAVAGLVRVLASQLVDGARFAVGQELSVGADQVRFAPFAGTELHLNNDALLITSGQR